MAKNPVVKSVAASERPYVCGQYTGTAGGTRLISLGFRPRAVLVEGAKGIRAGDQDPTDNSSHGGLALDGVPAFGGELGSSGPLIEITDDGFTVNYGCNQRPSSSKYYYRYLAFR